MLCNNKQTESISIINQQYLAVQCVCCNVDVDSIVYFISRGEWTLHGAGALVLYVQYTLSKGCRMNNMNIVNDKTIYK